MNSCAFRAGAWAKNVKIGPQQKIRAWRPLSPNIPHPGKKLGKCTFKRVYVIWRFECPNVIRFIFWLRGNKEAVKLFALTISDGGIWWWDTRRSRPYFPPPSIYVHARYFSLNLHAALYNWEWPRVLPKAMKAKPEGHNKGRKKRNCVFQLLIHPWIYVSDYAWINPPPCLLIFPQPYVMATAFFLGLWKIPMHLINRRRNEGKTWGKEMAIQPLCVIGTQESVRAWRSSLFL